MSKTIIYKDLIDLIFLLFLKIFKVSDYLVDMHFIEVILLKIHGQG